MALTNKTMAAPAGESLVKVVTDMKARGKSNKEIIDELKAKGHSSEAILEGMKKAQLKSAAAGGGDLKLEPTLEPEAGDDIPRPAEGPESDAPKLSTDDFEALAEKIIEEKWGTVEKEITGVKEWKSQVDETMAQVKERVEAIGTSMTDLKSSIDDKIGGYTKTMEELMADVQAMDMIFKQVLPEFTENIKALSAIVGRMRGKPVKAATIPAEIPSIVDKPKPAPEPVPEEEPVAEKELEKLAKKPAKKPVATKKKPTKELA